MDRRTGKRVSAVTWMSEESAWASIAEWEERDKRGGRPDVHHLMGHLEPRREESNGEE